MKKKATATIENNAIDLPTPCVTADMSSSKISKEALKILSLYRKILRLHEQKLPAVPRALGDKYVRKEFRAHKTATPEQLNQFVLQWTEYVAHLTTEADLFGLGRDLPQDEIESMNDQQHEQLQKIHDSAIKFGPDGRHADDQENGQTTTEQDKQK